MSNKLATTLESATFLSDEIALLLTPKKLRATSKVFGIGHILAALPPMALFIPIIVLYSQNKGLLMAMLTFLVLAVPVVVALSLISFGKQAAIRVGENLEKVIDQIEMTGFEETATSLLLRSKQVVFGGLMAILFIVVAQASRTLQASNILVKISVSLAVGYAGFLVSTGIYLVICIPRILRELSSAKPINLALFPYQTPEFKNVAEISISMSFFGALAATGVSSLFLVLASIAGTYESLYWTIILISILITTWIAISIPFFASQSVLAKLIRRGKEDILSRLRSIIQASIHNLEQDDEKALSQLEKLQVLYDQVYRSPDTTLNWNILGRYISSLIISIIPLVVGTFLENLLP